MLVGYPATKQYFLYAFPAVNNNTAEAYAKKHNVNIMSMAQHRNTRIIQTINSSSLIFYGRLLILFVFLMASTGGLLACQMDKEVEPVKVGLLASFSGSEAASGDALERGMSLAIQEINENGGVLERPLKLVVRNVNIKKGKSDADALQDLLAEKDITAVFGGTFNGVTPQYLDLIHEHQLPFINIWGTVTQVVKNDYDPNFVFCLAMTNLAATEFLARYGINIVGVHHPSILAETTVWGDSVTQQLVDSLTSLGVPPVEVARFDPGDRFMTEKLEALQAADADSIFLIGGTLESTSVMRGRATMNWSVPVLSHWGTSNRAFLEQTGIQNTGQLYVLQTVSFTGARSPALERLLKRYHAKFTTTRLGEISEPMGVAHGYDSVYLLAQAINQSQSTDGQALKNALEHLNDPYIGIVKSYERPFSPENHIALKPEDYMMAIWQNGRLMPAPRPRLEN